MQPFLALITPVGSTGPVDPGWSGGVAPPGGQPPLGIWGPPQMPPGIWPSPPGSRPPSGAHPSHPIYNPAYPDNTLPQPPLGTWGGVAPPYPDQGLPQPPLGTWGPNDPRPSQPIYVPPQAPVIDPIDPNKAYIVAYVPGQGRITFTVDIPPAPEPPTEATPK